MNTRTDRRMNMRPNMKLSTKLSTKSVWTSVLAALLSLGPIGASAALGADSAARRLPGFVDGSGFGELAGDEHEIVEVSLGPSMLGALARGAAKDPEAESVLSGLKSVTAYILQLDGDAPRIEQAAKLIRETAERLEHGDWERIARVREAKEHLEIFVLSADQKVQGLVVLILDRDSGEVVFANLAGTIDLARIGEISDTIHIPGLNELKKKGGTGDEGESSADDAAPSGSKPSVGEKPKAGAKPDSGERAGEEEIS